MNRHSILFPSLLLVLGAWHTVQAANVQITMNSVTGTMTLSNVAGIILPETSKSGSTYTFENLPEGEYTISGYNSSSELNGTMTITVGDEDITMQIWTVTKISTSNKRADNSYWLYGADFTIEDCEVHSREGITFPVTVGINAGYPSVLTYNGGSVILRLVPSAARQAEGYISANDGRTVTANTTIQTKIPMGGTYTATCPADAEIAIMQKPGGDGGSGTIHYVPFRLIDPESVTTTGSTKTYTWRLGDNALYNLRAWKEGGLTQLLTFYYNLNPDKCPVFHFTEAEFSARSPKWVDHDPTSLDKLNDCNILLNINEKGYLKLNVGQEYDLLAERDWQIIPDQTANYFLEPDYHYAVYDTDGNPDNSVVEVVEDGYVGSQWRILRAKSAGTAIVTVTYDAASAMQYNNQGMGSTYYGGQYFGALWPENTGVFVVSVGDDANNIDANMRINEDYNEATKKNAGIYVDAEHDVFYYINDEEAFNYTFTPAAVTTVEISYPTIRTNDAVYSTGWHTVAKNANGSYTLPLKHGRQIVRLGDGAGHYEYQVLTAKHATREILNESTGSKTVFRPGDVVRVQYDGLYHPANKLSGIYNMSAYITYNGIPAGTALILGSGQYWFAGTPSAQAVVFTIPAEWTASTYDMTKGVLQVTGYGDPIGNHRNIDKVGGRSPNFTAVSHQTYFGALPDATIPVTQLRKTLVTFAMEPADAVISSVTNSLRVAVEADGNGKYLLTEGNNTLLASKEGYTHTPVTIHIPEDCPAEMTIPVQLVPIPENGWDGEETTEPEKIGSIYHIKNGAELAWFAAQVNATASKSYDAVLDNDIDLCGFNWTPIGTTSGNDKAYKGTFDGQNHTITNLLINNAGKTMQGLFGALGKGAHVSNMTIRGTISSTYTGNAGAKMGGLTGSASGAQDNPVYISNITNYVNLTGVDKYAAGIVGYATSYVYIDRCANYGSIALSHQTAAKATDAAGIACLTNANSGITNSYNCGKITANNNVGGIYASTVNATVTNVYNTGYVHANRSNNSGLQCHGAIRPTANTTAETNQVTNAYANEDFLFNELNTTIITDPEAWCGGEIAYKLGEAFGQEIGVDALPVLGGMTVYEIERPDGTKFYANQDLKYYTRDNLTPGRIGTYCLEYASALTEGATFYRLLYKTLDENGEPYKLFFEEVTELEAGQPYIFLPEEEAFIVYYVEENAAMMPGNANGLYGTFEYMHGAALEGYYLISQNKIVKSGANSTLQAHRAYIKMDEVALKDAPNAPNPVPGRRRLVLGQDKAMIPTDINTIQNNEELCSKVLRDGTIYIIRNGKIYDVTGRKINY